LEEKAIPLHASERAGSSGTLFFPFRRWQAHQESGGKALHLRQANVATMKKRDGDQRRNPSP
jgi:hypothetical protein